jgi:sarcosine oxidase, subunit delta
MMQIQCPWCGVRDEEEFRCGGQSHIQRPEQPQECSDQQWAHYMFDRINPMGLHQERWCHTFGCRQWFNLARNTVSHDIVCVYKMGEAAPDFLNEKSLSSKPVNEVVA